MSKDFSKESWLGPVSVYEAQDYIKRKFPEAQEIQVESRCGVYVASFYNGSDVFEDLTVVMLDPFMTSIDGCEIDQDWIKIVRSCNEYRTIDGWTYDQDLVRSLELIVYNKKNAAIKRAEENYKKDVNFLNNLFKNLKIEEEIEPRQI